MSQWSERLEVLERVVVILAALLALFPLYQYYIEADDRKSERENLFVSAYSVCATAFPDYFDAERSTEFIWFNIDRQSKIGAICSSLAAENDKLLSE